MPQIHDVDELIETLRAPDGGVARLAGAVASGELQDYLETRRHLEWPLRRHLGALIERLQDKPALALFALRHTLTDDRLELVPGVAIRAPEEIVPLVAAGAPGREAVLRALRTMVADGRLGEWLRGFALGGGQGAVEAMEAARRAYPREVDLPLHALLWSVAPDLGFPVDDRWIKTPKDLAAWIDGDASRRERALALLDRGWIPTWLRAIGALGDANRPVDLLPPALPAGARADFLLGLLDPGRPSPRVRATPGRIRIGRLRPDMVEERSLTVSAEGGFVWGACALEGDGAGLRVEPLSFEGTPAEIRLRVDTTGSRPGTNVSAALALNCFDGRSEQALRVPIHYRVRIPVIGKIGRSILAGSIAGLVMGLLRLVAGSVISGQGAEDQPLQWVPFDWVRAALDRSFIELIGLLMLSLALVSVLIGIGIYVVHACGRNQP